MPAEPGRFWQGTEPGAAAEQETQGGSGVTLISLHSPELPQRAAPESATLS